ncbi:glutamate--cysteine ligase regulatory subunit [Calliphora vicina]|uniref:glutamate--cysteine ligase regulatory subunit n=1 Tax=Calliphora vicina TaxID=7373 RepID=UPI00325B683B
MLSEIVNNSKLQKVIISTGNILNVDNATPLRKSNEELLESLKLCTDCQKAAETECSNEQAAAPGGCGGETQVECHETEAQVLRANRELQERIKEYARNEISIGVKLFLNKSSKQGVEEAVSALMHILKVEHVDNLVLAYHPLETASKALPETPDVTSTVSYTGDLKWSKRNEKSLDVLKDLWQVLQDFNEKKKICQLGIADLDCDALTELHRNARVPPTINQINLANCCVVPPELKEFCTQHDIQLLTHGDPEILINDENFIIPNYTVDWSLRYQIHVRCRGVLTAKGYILQASKLPPNPTARE